MTRAQYLYLSFMSLGLVAFAVVLQQVGYQGVSFLPCPLCILQRVAYLGIAMACLGAYFSNALRRFFHVLASTFSLFGLGVVFRHIWVIFHPTVSCGLDPLEVWINQWAIVRWFDWLLKADGLCSAPLPPILGLTVPFWSLVWLTAITTILLLTLVSALNKKAN